MISLRRGDLWVSTMEAIAREATDTGVSRSSVGRRTDLAMGPELLDRIEAMGEMPVGTAMLTKGGELPASFALHIFLTSREEPISARGVEKGLRNALARVADFGIVSVAFPPLGLGAGSLDAETSADILIAALGEHLETGAAPQEFEIVVETDYEEEVFGQALARLQGAESA